jgi:ABC-type multidrug transport system fused ATPase/permease subunit
MTDPKEEQGESRLSLQPMRRLLAASQAHHKALLWASLFAMLLAGLDISLPLLLRRAVDRHVKPSWAVVQADRLEIRDAADAAGALPLGEARVLVDLTRLGEALRQQLTRRADAPKERYYRPLEESQLADFPEALRVNLRAGSTAIPPPPPVWVVENKQTESLTLRQRLSLHSADFPALRKLALIYGLILVISFLGTCALTLWLSRIAQEVMSGLRIQLYEHLLRLPVSFFDTTAVGRLLTRVTSDVEVLAEVFTQAIVFLLKDFVLILGSLAIMLALSWRLTVALMAMLPLLLAMALLFKKLIRGAYRTQRAALAKLNGFIQEAITGVRVIQAFRAEPFFRGRLDELNHDNFMAGLRMMEIFAIFRPLIELIGSAAIMLLVWRAAPDIFGGALPLGVLFAMVIYLQMLMDPIRDLTEKYNILQSGASAAERIFGLLDQYEEDIGGRTRKPVSGEIEFKNVWFAYKGEEWVLRDVSFKIGKGQSAAVVGHTGSGKTTLIALLLRFYEPQRGEIFLDGIEIRKWNKHHLRRAMALVLQDVHLIEGTVAENIAFLAGGDAEQPDTARAAAGLLDRLPAGLQTPVGEGGRGLSQGEKQLVAAARALAQQPAVLLMDEATAAVDSATEVELQRAVAELTRGRTSIIIAHRLSTIEHADLILVMHAGEIKERGTHAELIAADGMYRGLHELQFRSLSASKTHHAQALTETEPASH